MIGHSLIALQLTKLQYFDLDDQTFLQMKQYSGNLLMTRSGFRLAFGFRFP